MLETVRDWQSAWIEQNGKTDDTEVLIESIRQDGFTPYLYEGSFAKIPEKFLDKKVVEHWKIVNSSEPERVGAYTLSV